MRDATLPGTINRGGGAQYERGRGPRRRLMLMALQGLVITG